LKKEKYILLLDEYFIYFARELEKRVGNFHDIRKISNIDTKESEEGNIKITLVFNLSSDSIDEFHSKIKEIEFEKSEARNFIEYLKIQLKRYNIPLI
jgi:hypothetical protein